jgi:hypothetical protein
MVRFLEGGTSLVYAARDLYMLINLGVAPNISTINAARVEPFNVVFETPLSTHTTVIKDGTNSAGLNINDITLTNSPVSTTPDNPPNTKYRFLLNNDTLTLDQNMDATINNNDGILSVNGIHPVNGDIQIQFL